MRFKATRKDLAGWPVLVVPYGTLKTSIAYNSSEYGWNWDVSAPIEFEDNYVILIAGYRNFPAWAKRATPEEFHKLRMLYPEILK